MKLLDAYNYDVPAHLIASAPASPRDSARLLIHDQALSSVRFDTFKNLPKYLPKGAVLVFNKTKVLPARLCVTKETGGKANLLYIGTDQKFIKTIADRKLPLGSTLFIKGRPLFTVHHQREKYYFLAPLFPSSQLPQILQTYGRTPIPPYIKNSPLREAELREKYQTVFAQHPGSVAAPTASLHFTNRLLTQLKRTGIEIQFVTLHVNLGTFAPLTPEQLQKNKLHEEYFGIPKKTATALQKAKNDGRPIIAVGTTVVRTLESAANRQGIFSRLRGATDLFIRERYRFKMISGLITNFHVPRSSLLMLVSALVGRKKLLELYQTAVRKKFRLFSFGDGMLIL